MAPYDRPYGEGVLTATTLIQEQILVAESIILIIGEGGHQLDLHVATRAFLALRAGITVEIESEQVAGHHHPMRFEPNCCP